MPALTTKQITAHLKIVTTWSKHAQVILRTFKFEGFLKGIDFVNRIAAKAQKMNHHPDIDIRFDHVTLTSENYFPTSALVPQEQQFERNARSVLSRLRTVPA